jgi:hypothetical protein
MTAIRPLCAYSLVALALSGCAIPLSTNQVNRQACVARTRSAMAAQTDLRFTITNVSSAMQGSRVVVEGTLPNPLAPKHGLPTLLEKMLHPASAAAAASAALAASAPTAASAALAASAPKTASAALAASASIVPPGSSAAAECLFDGRQLSAFHWLTPRVLAAQSK